MKPTEIIPRFDEFLADRGLTLEAIVVGGTALALLGIILRETRDCDVIEPELTGDIREGAQTFAIEMRSQGVILRDDWLNNGPSTLAPLLPEGWRNRLQPLYQGRAITLLSLGRPELLLSKLFALCDRGLDIGDCIALAPTSEELTEAEAWIAGQDLNPEWPQHVRSTLEDVARRLGHGL